MKRLLRAVLLLALLLLPSPAGAADGTGLTLSAAVEPTSLYQPGTVTVSVDIANPSDTDATGLTLQVNGKAVSVPSTLKAGANTSVTASLSLDWGDFGSALPVTLTWEQDGAAKTASKSVTVTRIPSDPKLTFTRTADKDTVVRNESVVVTYTVTNSGKIDVDNVTIRDTGLNLTKNLGSLTAGSTQTYTETLRVIRSLTSNPVVSCDAVQSNYSFLPSVETLKITLLNPELTVKLDASPTAVTEGEAVTLVLTVTNTGDVGFKSLSISDPTLGSPFEDCSLAVGATRTFSQKVVPSGSSAKYQFTIKATSTGGKIYSYTSPEAAVTIAEATVPAMLTLYASSEVLRITTPGEVQITLLLENTGKDTLTGVSVYEEDLGLIRSFDQLPTGQNTFSCPVMVEETKTYRFYARVTDETGSVRDFYSEGVTIEYAVAATASPEPSPTPSADPEASSPLDAAADDPRTPFWKANPAMTLFLVLLALAALAATVGLIVYSARLNRRSRRRRRKPDPRRVPVRTTAYTTSVSRADSPSVAALREGRTGAASGDTLQFHRIITPEDTAPGDETREFSAIRPDEEKKND